MKNVLSFIKNLIEEENNIVLAIQYCHTNEYGYVNCQVNYSTVTIEEGQEFLQKEEGGKLDYMFSYTFVYEGRRYIAILNLYKEAPVFDIEELFIGPLV